VNLWHVKDTANGIIYIGREKEKRENNEKFKLNRSFLLREKG